MAKRKVVYDPETDRFFSAPNDYRFRVCHSRKQRLILNALRDQFPHLTDPAEITASAQMVLYLEKLLVSRVYARTN